MYYPTFDEIRHLRDAEMSSHTHAAKPGRPLLPLYRDVLCDLETPVSAYCKTAKGPYSFLLESVTGGEHAARFSLIGIDPYLVIIQRGETATLYKMAGTLGRDKSGSYDGMITAASEEIACHDPLQLVESELSQYRLVMPAGIPQDELPRFHGGAVGYLAYEAASRFEHLPVPEKNEPGLPLAVFCFTETVLVFDHVKHRVRMVTHLHLDAPDLEAEYRRGMAILDNVQERLRQPVRLPEEPVPLYDPAGLQVTSNRTQAEFEEMVRRSIAYIQAGDVFQIVGASPELLVRFEDNEVTIRPIAGTRPRGTDRQSDQRFAEELKNDPKERAEHIMLVDLARNDVGRVSIPGSIQVGEFMEIERYSHVMHLVSNIAGQLRDEVTPYDALRAGFPAGTVSGAPKIRAMQIISELEAEQRGVYAGAVGYFSHSGNQETAIALRTMVIKDGRAYIQAGCGVVADSDPTGEYQESLHKARALLRALDEAETIAQERRQDALID